MKKIEVELEGISPLLVNRFLDKQISEKAKKHSAESMDSPVSEKLYLLNNKPYLPARYFEASLIEAGKQFKIAGKNRATYSKYLGATIRIDPEAILLAPNKYEVYSIAGVNPMTKGRIMIHRPRFEKWGCKFVIVCEEDNIEVDTVQRILEFAGRFVGVGDWRPDKKGRFGKYRIVQFKEVN